MTTFRRGLDRFDDLADITAGPDGNLWITARSDGAVIRMAPTGAVTGVIRLPRGTEPQDITAGPDGNVWFLYEHVTSGDTGIGSVTPLGQSRLIPDAWSGPGSIAAGPGDSLWIGDPDERSVLRVTTAGTVSRVKTGVESEAVVGGPDGNVWFSYFRGVGRIAPDGGDRQLYKEPFGSFGPTDIAFDATGNLWGTAFSEYSLLRLALAPAGPPPLEPVLPRAGAVRSAYTIARGREGAMWIAGRRAIVRLDAAGNQTVLRPRPAPNGTIAPSRDEGLWYAFGGRGVARIEPDGTVRRLTRGFPRKARVFSLAHGARGIVWFIDYRRRIVGRLAPSGRVRMFRRGFGRRPDLLNLAVGPDRRLWITDQGGAILSMSRSGRVRRFTRGLGPRAAPTAITPGPDGNLWFTEFGSRHIGRITPAGRIKRWRPRELPASIAGGPDGALWFTTAAVDTDDATSGVGRITTRGKISEFFVRATNSTGFEALAPGPDGKVWFVEAKGPIAIARIDPQRLAALGSIPIR